MEADHDAEAEVEAEVIKNLQNGEFRGQALVDAIYWATVASTWNDLEIGRLQHTATLMDR